MDAIKEEMRFSVTDNYNIPLKPGCSSQANVPLASVQISMDASLKRICILVEK
jgi:hypothetical protein